MLPPNRHTISPRHPPDNKPKASTQVSSEGNLSVAVLFIFENGRESRPIDKLIDFSEWFVVLIEFVVQIIKIEESWLHSA